MHPRPPPRKAKVQVGIAAPLSNSSSTGSLSGDGMFLPAGGYPQQQQKPQYASPSNVLSAARASVAAHSPSQQPSSTRAFTVLPPPSHYPGSAPATHRASASVGVNPFPAPPPHPSPRQFGKTTANLPASQQNGARPTGSPILQDQLASARFSQQQQQQMMEEENDDPSEEYMIRQPYPSQHHQQHVVNGNGRSVHIVDTQGNAQYAHAYREEEKSAVLRSGHPSTSNLMYPRSNFPHKSLSHSVSQRSVGGTSTITTTGGGGVQRAIQQQQNPAHLSSILTFLTNPKIFLLSEDLQAACDSGMVDQLVYLVNAGGAIGNNGVNLSAHTSGNMIASSVRAQDIYKHLQALNDAERQFYTLKSLVRAVRMLHFIPIDVRKHLYEWTLRCNYLKQALSGQHASTHTSAHPASHRIKDNSSTSSSARANRMLVSANEIDEILDETNVGTHLIAILKELEAAGRVYSGMEQLCSGIKSTYAVPLSQRKHVLDFLQANQTKLFTTNRIADGLGMQDIHNLYDTTQCGVHASKHLHSFLLARRRFDSFAGLVQALGKAIQEGTEGEDQASRGEARKVARYLAGEPGSSLTCPLFSPGAPPIAISRPVLHRLFSLGGGVHATRRHFQWMEAMEKRFGSFEQLTQGLVDAQARMQAELPLIVEFLNKKGSILPSGASSSSQQQQQQHNSSSSISSSSWAPSEAARLYLDGYSGEDTLMHLKAFAECGQRFKEPQEVVRALRAAHAAEVARRKALKDPRLYKEAFNAQSQHFDFTTPKGTQDALLAFLSSPSCLLFSGTAEDVHVTSSDLDKLVSVSGNDGESARFYLEHLNATLGTDASDAPEEGFQSIAQLLLAVQHTHLFFTQCMGSVMRHLKDEQSNLITPDLRDKLEETGVRKMMIRSEAGLYTLHVLREIDRDTADHPPSSFSPASSLSTLTSLLRSAYHASHEYTRTERLAGKHVRMDVKRELLACLSNSNPPESDVAQECALLLRRISKAEHLARAAPQTHAELIEQERFLATHAAFVPSTFSPLDVERLHSAASRVGPNLLLHLLHLLTSQKSYIDVRTLVDDVLEMSAKETAAVDAAMDALTAREAPFWAGLRDRAREERLQAAGFSPSASPAEEEAQLAEDHSATLRMLGLTAADAYLLFRAAGGIRSAFSSLEQLTLLRREFDSMQALLEEVERMNAQRKNEEATSPRSRASKNGRTTYELFAAMGAQELFLVQQACSPQHAATSGAASAHDSSNGESSPPSTAPVSSSLSVPSHTLRYLSHLQASRALFANTDEVLLALRKLSDASEEREYNAVVRRYTQGQFSSHNSPPDDSWEEHSTSSSSSSTGIPFPPRRPLPPSARSELLAFLTSPENLLFSDSVGGVNITNRDLDEMYQLAGGSVVEFLRFIQNSLSGRFSSAAELKRALAFQVLAHTQNVFNFLAGDHRLLSHARENSGVLMSFIGNGDFSAALDTNSPEGHATSQAIVRHDLLAIVRDVLFSLGCAGPQTLHHLEELLFLPEINHASPGLPLTVGVKEPVEVVNFESWVDLALQVRQARRGIDSETTKEYKLHLLEFFRSSDSASLFHPGKDGATVQIHDGTLSALLKASQGSLQNVMVHLRTMQYLRRSYSDSAELIEAVVRAQKEQMEMQRHTWRYLTHPQCALLSTPPGSPSPILTYSSVKTLLLASSAGVLAFGYVRAMEQRGERYGSVKELTEALKDLHQRSQAERAACIQRLFEYLNAEDCNLFVPGRDVTLKKSELEDLLAVEPASQRQEPFIGAYSSPTEITTERLIRERLIPLDQDPQQARFTGMQDLLKRVREMTEEETAVRQFVDGQTTLLPFPCDESSAAFLLASREGRTTAELLDELRRVDRSKRARFEDVAALVHALQTLRLSDAAAARSRLLDTLRSFLHALTGLFDGKKIKLDDADLEVMVGLTDSVEATKLECIALDATNAKYTSAAGLIDGVRGALALAAQQKDALAFLKESEKCVMLTEAVDRKSLTDSDIQVLYSSGTIGLATLPKILDFNGLGRKYENLEGLIADLKAHAAFLAEQKRVCEIVNHETQLLSKPSILTLNEAGQLLQVYQPRTIDDLADQLRAMNDHAVRVPNGAELVKTVAARVAADREAVRAFLKSSPGSSLLEQPDEADLSDAAVNAILAAGHSLSSVLDHSGRLLSASKSFPSTAALASAIRASYDADAEDRTALRKHVNGSSKLMVHGVKLSESDAALVLSHRDGRTLPSLLSELSSLDKSKSTPHAHAEELVEAIRMQRDTAARAERARQRAALQAYLESSGLFNGAKIEMKEPDLEALLKLGGSLQAAVSVCKHLDASKQRYSSLPALLDGVRLHQSIESQKKDTLAFLKDAQQCTFWSGVEAGPTIQKGLEAKDVDFMYVASRLELGTLPKILSLHSEKLALKTFDELIQALQAHADFLTQRARVLEYANTKSSLLQPPSSLQDSEADELLHAYAPRSCEDLLDTLEHMHSAKQSYPNGASLVAAIRASIAAEIASLRAHLQSDSGRKVFTDPASPAADLSDAALMKVLAAGHGAQSTIEQCNRLIAAGKTYPTTPDLAEAIRSGYASDAIGRALVRKFVNQESKLLQQGVACMESDAASLLALREGRTIQQLLGELSTCDRAKSTPFQTVEHIKDAVKQQRIVEERAERARQRAELQKYLEGSGLFDGATVPMSEGDLEFLLNACGTLAATIAVCKELDAAKQRYTTLLELTSGVRHYLAVDAQKKECLAFLRDKERCQLWKAADPSLQGAIDASHINRLYNQTKLGLGTLSKVQQLNSEHHGFKTFDDLITAMQAYADYLAQRARVLAYVNEQSQLIGPPATLKESEAEELLALYEPRATADDLLDQLKSMQAKGMRYKSGTELVNVVQQQVAADMEALRAHLKSAEGRKLYSSPDSADLSDSALRGLLAAGHGLKSTMDHCRRFAGAGAVFGSTGELAAAIRTAYAKDEADRSLLRTYVNTESQLLHMPQSFTELDTTVLLAEREGRSTLSLITELRDVDRHKAAPFKHADEIVQALYAQRLAAELAERARQRDVLKAHLEASQLFHPGQKPEMSDANLETLLMLSDSLDGAIARAKSTESAGQKFVTLPDYIAGVQHAIALEAQQKECLAYLKDTHACTFWSVADPESKIPKSLELKDVVRLYTETQVGLLTLPKVHQLQSEKVPLRTFEDLIAALKKYAEHLSHRARVLEYVNHQSRLLNPPAQLADAEAEGMMEIFAPRSTEDLLDTLRHMNDSHSVYHSGAELVAAMKAQKAEEIHTLRAYLQADPGRQLYASSAQPDLSDATVYSLLTAGHGLTSTLDHCARLLVSGAVHADTPALAAAIAGGYAADLTERELVRKYVNAESKLLKSPATCSELDAATLLTLREGRSTKQLLGELQQLDASKPEQFASVEELIAALQSQRVEEALKEHARIKGELRAYLEGSSLFGGAKAPISDAELETLLTLGDTLAGTLKLCQALESSKQIFSSTQALIDGVKHQLALEAQQRECLAFLKDSDNCRFWSAVPPPGEVAGKIHLKDVVRMYDEAKLDLATLPQVLKLNADKAQLQTFDDLVAALKAHAAHLVQRSRVVEYVNTHSSLLTKSATLLEAVAADMMSLYAPSTTDDLIDTLQGMNASKMTYVSGELLRDALKAQKSADLAALKAHLQSESGKKLFSSPDTADLSDAALGDLLAAGHTLQSTLDQCDRLAAAGKIFPTTPALAESVRAGYAADSADRDAIRKYVNTQSKLLAPPTSCTEGDAAALLAVRAGRTTSHLLSELHSLSSSASSPFPHVPSLLLALLSAREQAAAEERKRREEEQESDRRKWREEVKKYLEGSGLFGSGVKPPMSEANLETFMLLPAADKSAGISAAAVTPAIALGKRLDTSKARFSTMPELLAGAKALLELEAQKRECREFLRSAEKCAFWSQSGAAATIQSSIDTGDIDRLYDAGKLAMGTLAKVVSMNSEGEKHSSFDDLVQAMKKHAEYVSDRARVLAYVNTKSSLLQSPSTLSESEADSLLTLYDPRLTQDLLDALCHRNDIGSKYRAGQELIQAMKASKAEEIVKLRAHLQTEQGKALYTSPETADLSDAAVWNVLAAGHGLASTIDHCGKLEAKKALHADTPALAAAVRSSYQADTADRIAVRKYVNDESALFKVPVTCSESDAATLLSYREGRSVKDLIGELTQCDRDKSVPFSNLDELLSALASQRAAELLVNQARLKNDLRAYLEHSPVFNGIKIKQSDADLETMLGLCRNDLKDTIGLVKLVENSRKRCFGLPDLITNMRKLQELELEKAECLRWMKDVDTCHFWSEVDPKGVFVQKPLVASDVQKVYDAAKMDVGTLDQLKKMDAETMKFTNLAGLLDALAAHALTLASRNKSIFGRTLSSAAKNSGDDDDEDGEEDAVGALPSGALSPRSGVDSPSSMMSQALSEVRDDDDETEDDTPMSPIQRVNSISGRSDSSVNMRPAKRQNSTQWMDSDLAEQLIEQADPSTFEEYACMRIKCLKLAHVGKIGMSNIFVQFSRERGHIWEKCGGTDFVKDDLSPSFDLLILSLQKMCHMKLDRKVKIEALETATSDGHKHALIGHIITTPAEILANGPAFQWDLRHPEKEKSKSYKNSGVLVFEEFKIMVNTTKGVLNCSAQSLFETETNCRLRIQATAKNIEKMDLFGKSDAYCVFHLASGHGAGKTYREIHKTEVQHKTLNPVFQPFVKTVAEFCERDYDRRIRVKMYDWDNVGEHDYIGTFDMTVRSMLNPKSKFRVINEEKLTASLKPGGEKYKHSGTVTFKVAQHFTMIHDVDREADIALVKHRRAYKEAEMNPTKRKAFLSYMAGGHALVKAQALLRMATGMNSHKSAEELLDETNRARQQKQQQEVLQTQGLQRMQTNLDLFKKAAAVDETISLSVRGESLAAMDLFSSDPYLEFHKFNRSTGAFEKCAGSEVVKNTLNPKWPPILLASRDLITDTGNPLDTKVNVLQVKCFDWNSDGSVDYMGEFRTSYPEIRKCKETKFDLVWTDPANPTKTKIKGQIVFESCKAVQMKVEKREVSQSATLMDHGEKEKKKKRQTLKRVATLSKASLQ